MGCKQCKILFTKPVKSTVNFTNIQPTRTSSEIVTVQPTNSSSLSSLTFENLPVELIHHILDRLDTDTIFSSLYNVSPHLNSILRTYDRYKLDFQSISLRYFHRICSLIRPEQIISMTLCDGNETVGLVELFLRKFPMDSFQQLQSLTLVNIDDNEQMIRILLSITDRLRELSIENSNEVYEDTVMDILMIVIGKSSLRKLSLDMERERISNPSILWPMECFLQDIRLAGLCNLSLLRQILISSPNLRKFQAFDIDFDDEWIDENDEQELEHSPILPIVNACHLTSLSLTYARNEMEKLEWLLPQFTQLISFKYLNIYDIHIEPLYENDYSLLDGERWKKLLINCERFEFIFTIHPEADDDDDDEDDSWNIHQCFATFQTQFWKDKQWYTALEQYEKFLLIYSLPYSHHSHYYDRPKYHSLANHPFLRMQSMEFVTKLRINLPAINENFDSPCFPHVTQLTLDGSWRHPTSIDTIRSLIDLTKIEKFVRLERVPTVIFQTFLSHLSKLKSLTLTSFVLDSLNAAIFQYRHCLPTFHIMQFDDHYRYFVNVEPFCTMFPRIEHLDIPIDNLDSCQYVLDRLGKVLLSVIFRFPSNHDEDEDDEPFDDDDNDDDDDEHEHHRNKYYERIQWARNIPNEHHYRIRDGNMYLWLE